MPIKNTLKNDVLVRGGRYEMTIPWDTGNGAVPAGFTDWSVGVYLGETHESDESILEYTTDDLTVTLTVGGAIQFVIESEESSGISTDLSEVCLGVWRLDDDSEVPLFKGQIKLSDVLLKPTTTTTTAPP